MIHKDKSSFFGIHMRQYCSQHETRVRDRLESGGADEALLSLHGLKLAWLQHERLVHLIVLLITVLLFLFSIGLFIALCNLFVLLLVAITLALHMAYIRHYFILENTVQSWYLLYDRIYEEIRK